MLSTVEVDILDSELLEEGRLISVQELQRVEQYPDE